MIDRRTLLLMTGAAVLTLAAPAPLVRAWAQASQGRATDFVRQTADRLTSVVNGNAPDKRHQLQQVIDQAVDVDAVGQFCLGRYWRVATPEQQKAYLGLFHDVLMTNITGHLGEYQGVRVTIGRSQSRDEYDVVSSTVERPNNPPTNVDWVISSSSGAPRIIDVVAEGTSLRLTQRSDYASFMSHNNNDVNALINALKQQVAQSG